MDAKTTGKMINTKRKEKGLTQIQLAELLNVSNRAVSKWENGDGFPDITLLPLLSKELDITIDELLTGIKPEPVIKFVERDTDKRKKLINDFKIGYVIALCFSAFAALLGGLTELYCTWAFGILFYTHWEIMFAAVSLFSIVAGGLIFFVSVTRLHLVMTKSEMIKLSLKKGLALVLTSLVFPLLMLARIIHISRWGNYTFFIMIAITAVLVFVIIKGYKKIKDIENEKINEDN